MQVAEAQGVPTATAWQLPAPSQPAEQLMS